MIFRQGFIICITVLGLLSGCALSPQQLTPNPVISQSLPQVGHGQAVSVQVVDQRQSPLIGARGGVYSSTSNISLQSNDVVPKLQQQAEQALTKMGYKPQSGGAVVLTIIIDTITYTPSDSSFANNATVKVVLRSQVQNAGKTYNGRYTSSVAQTFTTAPSLETNNKLVGEVLGNALTSLFKDTHLAENMQ